MARRSLARSKKQRTKKNANALPAHIARLISKLRNAGQWPVVRSLISEETTVPHLAHAVIARKRPDDTFTVACFLLDPGCLGVKDIVLKHAVSRDAVEDLLISISEHTRLEDCDPACVKKIVLANLQYAQSLGFEPYAEEWPAAKFLLDGIDATTCTEVFVCGGPDGKPQYMSGPRDDVAAIMATLDKSVGQGQYQFTARLEQLPGDANVLDEIATDLEDE